MTFVFVTERVRAYVTDILLQSWDYIVLLFLMFYIFVISLFIIM